MQDGVWSVVHRYFAHYTVGHVGHVHALCSLEFIFGNSCLHEVHI